MKQVRAFDPFIWAVVTIAAYVACLRFAFPGELHSLTPHHPDMYLPVALLGKSTAGLLLYPRPLTFLFMQASGLLGISGAIAATITIVLATVVLIAVLVSRVSGHRVELIAYVAFVVLLFSHPQFYFHHRFDVASTLATFFLFIALLATGSWLTTRRRRDLVLALASIAAMSFSKETYAISAPLLLAALCVLRWRKGELRPTLLLVAGACAIEIAATVFNTLRFLHYAGSISATSTYAPRFHAISVLQTLWRYLGDLLPPHLLVIAALGLIGALLALRREPRKTVFVAALILAGIAALIPNSVLPGHYESRYAYGAAPLVFASVLFLPASRPWRAAQAAFLLLAVLSIHWNAAAYHSTTSQWTLDQERANARILAALPRIRSELGASRRVLVSGLAVDLNPWESPGFAPQYFGAGRAWTVIVPKDRPVSNTEGVALVHLASVHPETEDAAVRFSDDGHLLDVLAGPAYRDAVRSNPDAVLIPGLAAPSDDFKALLDSGTRALTWGLPDRAIVYLKRAAQLAPTNPYPWYFTGKAQQDLNDTTAARAAYEKAIALDGRAPNPAFREALQSLQR